MKRIIVIALIISSSVFAIYEFAGTSGMTFLKMNFSPRAAALGDASVGYANGPDGMLSNPAAMSFEKDMSVGTSFGMLYAGISSGHLVAQKRFGFGKIGIATRFVSYGTMDRTDGQGEVLGDFGSTDLAFSVLYSREIFDNFSLGFAPFFASSSIDTFVATAIGVDLGALLKFDRGRGRVGMAVKNLGGQLSACIEKKDTLATTVGLGASYRLKGMPVYALAEGDYCRDSGFSAGFGMELVHFKPLSIRAGYRIRDKVSGDLAEGEALMNGLTAGFGLHHKGIYADYSFQHYGVLGFTHKFAVAFDGFASE